MSTQLKKPAPGVPYCTGCGAKGHFLCSTCSNKRRDEMHQRLGTPTLPITDDDDDMDSGLQPMSKNKKRKKRKANRDGQYDRHYTPNFE